MTKLWDMEHGDPNPYPARQGLKNFIWTNAAVSDWEDTWNALWHIGIKWEWQNSDRYARGYGDKYTFFACHNDAVRLDMAIPLPGIDAVLKMHEYLLDLPTDDYKVDEATNLIRKWIRNYVG